MGRHGRRLDDGGRRAALAADRARRRRPTLAGWTFVQISDSHIGFNKDANTDVPGTLKAAIDADPEAAAGAIVHAAHRRHQPPVQARGVRSRRPAHRRGAAAGVLRPGRARHAGRRRRGLPRALRHAAARVPAGTASTRTACISSAWSMSSTSRPAAWAGWATSSSNGSRTISPAVRPHADRGVRPHPAVGGLSRMGLGHGGCRAGAGLSQAVRLGHRPQRPHPPGDAEGRGQRHLPHRDVDGLPAAQARRGGVARADEGAGRAGCGSCWAPATSPSRTQARARWRSSTSRWRRRERGACVCPGEPPRVCSCLRPAAASAAAPPAATSPSTTSPSTRRRSPCRRAARSPGSTRTTFRIWSMQRRRVPLAAAGHRRPASP